jgi:hypothetical protein
MDSSEEDQRLEHHRDPPHFIVLDELFRATGVEYFEVSTKCWNRSGNQCEAVKVKLQDLASSGHLICSHCIDAVKYHVQDGIN